MNWLIRSFSFPTGWIALVVYGAMFMIYRLAQSALRIKGTVHLKVTRGKTSFELDAKECAADKRDQNGSENQS